MAELTNGDQIDPLEAKSRMRILTIQNDVLAKKEAVYLWEPRPMPEDFGHEPIPVRSRPRRRSSKR